jgi:hypothetical protein
MMMFLLLLQLLLFIPQKCESRSFQKLCFSSFVEGLAEMKDSSEKCKTESWRRKRETNTD